MQSIKLICGFVFILVLILCNETLNVEARHLKPENRKKSSKHSENNTLKVLDHGNGTRLRDEEHRSSKADFVDDFRPTAPGHSPGVGHSINN